ncbi:chemotaxis protein CheW [Eleftheria terrae]|uniref:chemotaxis protein CheW n=1 Tax=Eleftheria terrae TaxID=1597781 RepID=UPI00263B87C6|nr:chemotaxis protein CheW [Eleftheria terrae]WKB50741.1 chemotaxis protein CheW [Eleftheria terrae]
MDTALAPVPAEAMAAPLSLDPAQYLTFMLNGEAFAIGILSIKEIIEYHGLTTVPMMPGCVRGVINLRGAVVPVIDLQARFGRGTSPVTKRTCIVIVETQHDDGRQVVGVIVDVVNEVLEIAPADVEPAPAFGARINTEYIAGIGKVRGKFVILLQAEAVLRIDDDSFAEATPRHGRPFLN